MVKTVSQKMGIKVGIRAILFDAPDDAVDAIKLPDIEIIDELSGEFDYIHLFVKEQSDLKKKFPVCKSHLKSTGMLWVSWPKNRQLGTDLNLKIIIHIGYGFGLVESTFMSINSIWSALKFTFPKKGKVYNNSYGELNQSSINAQLTNSLFWMILVNCNN